MEASRQSNLMYMVINVNFFIFCCLNPIVIYNLVSRIHGVYHAFVKILSEGGIRGLWAGWIPNVQRAALVSLGGNLKNAFYP